MKYKILLLILLGLSSCAKDDIITETKTGNSLGTISGQALIDTNCDGEGDTPPSTTLNVYYIDSLIFNYLSNATCKDLDSLVLAEEIIGKTETDEDGNFEFTGVQPDENNFLYLCSHNEWEHVIGLDTTPDGDEGEDIPQVAIPISIDENENDSDNVFLITKEKGSIKGIVEVDLDGDGIADVPVSQADLSPNNGRGVILLQKDEINDLYVMHRVVEVDENGKYTFDNLTEGQYIVRSAFEAEYVIFSEDESPDFDGIPTSNEADIDVFIAQNETDSDNNFILQKPLPLLGVVSGLVTRDLNSDGVGDMPLNNFTVEIREWDGVSPGELLLSAVSDENGEYEFQDVPLGEYALTISELQGLNVFISYDNSGDPISGPGPHPTILLLDMTSGEIDSDNIFVLAQWALLSISGYVLDDVDGDGNGDEGLDGHRIALHYRSENGVPTIPVGSNGPIAVDYTDVDGAFNFYNIPAGEYVLYHIGTGDYPYTCISGEDQSPETGEPTTSPECQFIPVDLTDDVEDLDNIYTLDKQ